MFMRRGKSFESMVTQVLMKRARLDVITSPLLTNPNQQAVVTNSRQAKDNRWQTAHARQTQIIRSEV